MICQEEVIRSNANSFNGFEKMKLSMSLNRIIHWIGAIRPP